MKVQQVQIEGYRSLRSITWNPGRLNVLIGPNGSGKSNLLRALKLISTAASGGLAEAVLREGGMAPLVWDGAATEIGFVVTTDPVKPGEDPQREALIYTLKLRRLGTSGAYEIGREELTKYQVSPESLNFLERRANTVAIYDEHRVLLGPSSDTVPPEEPALSLVTALWGNSVVSEFQKLIRSWAIHHDMRVDEGAAIRQAAVTRHEKRVAPDAQNLIPVLHTLYEGDRGFEDRIDKAMSAAFPDDYEKLKFTPAEDNRIQLRLRRRKGNRLHTAADLSDGTLRFLVLLAILASPDPAPLIAIDEPEVGLHPSMLPIIAEFATDAATRSQVIFSTHSPGVLDAFQDTLPTTTVFSWVGDQTALKTIEANELRTWVADYTLGKFAFSGEAEAVM